MYRRLGVYRTFLTGILIGLFFVVIVSDNASKLIIFSDQGIIDQDVLVLTFSGILGGVLYTIVVDGVVEMPRFVNEGDSFEAGLFGDILLGIAGAFILEFLTSSIETTGSSSFVLLAAKGMIGGYGGKALMNMALNRFLRRLEKEREQKEEAEETVRRLREGQRLMDRVSEHIDHGLSAAELEELRYAIQHASAEERTQIFKLTKEFRSMSSRSSVLKTRIQRMIPVFDALVASDPENHEYHAQLAFAYKDAANPNYQAAITHLNQAIQLRGEANRSSTWKYELNRAIATIQQTVTDTGSYRSPELVSEAITRDLLAVLNIHSLDSILKDAQENHIPTPIQAWIQHNQGFLNSHREAAPLLQQMQQRLTAPSAPTTPPLTPDISLTTAPSTDPGASSTGEVATDASLAPSTDQSLPKQLPASVPQDGVAPVDSSHPLEHSTDSAPLDAESLVEPSTKPLDEPSTDTRSFDSSLESGLRDIRTVIEREVTGVMSIEDWTPDLFRSIKHGLIYLGFLNLEDDDFESFEFAWAQFKASVDRGGSNRIGKDSAALFLNALERKADETSDPFAEESTPESNEAHAPIPAAPSPVDGNGSATPEVTEWDDAPISDLVPHPTDAVIERSVASDPLVPTVSGHSFTWRSRWDVVLPEVPTTGASAETSKQDNLVFNGLLASNQLARKDLPEIEKLVDRFCRAAAKYEVPAPLLAAIASRESRGGKLLDAKGMGDHGNAFGIMQIDKRHHTPAGMGGDPASQVHIDQSAEILANNIKRVRAKFPDWENTYILKAAVAAYNFGTKNVHTKEGIDKGTTGDDYGSDVIARAKFFTNVFEQVSPEASLA
ncbi:MAG: transglycosylase SLT domain-containing protein [Leptolyngbyaceae bacterium]|nr:transglycosylase SLT domain-containing protein [Leptolyngbyaceae bacterium]